MTIFNKILLPILFLFIVSCSNNSIFGTKKIVKHPGERISVTEDLKPLHAEENLKNYQISLPKKKSNIAWQASDLNQNELQIQNLALHYPLSQSETYNLEKFSANKIYSIPPVISKNKLYVTNNKIVNCYDINNKFKLLWSYKIESDEKDLHGGGLAESKGIIYVTYGYKEVLAISADTGLLKWRTTLAGITRAKPVIDKDMLFISSTDNQLYGLETPTGSLVWKHQSLSPKESILKYPHPITSEGYIFMPYTSGEYYILNKDSGEEIMQVDFQQTISGANVISPITTLIDDNIAFLVNRSGMLIAKNLEDGDEIWTKDLSLYQSIWLAGDVMYVASASGDLAAIDKNTGKVIWAEKITLSPAVKVKSIMMVDDKLMLEMSNGFIVFLSPKDAKDISSINLNVKNAKYSIMIVENKLFVLSGSKIQVWN